MSQLDSFDLKEGKWTPPDFDVRTVKPGVRYAYVIVAVDKATPPNRSAPSARVEETAR